MKENSRTQDQIAFHQTKKEHLEPKPANDLNQGLDTAPYICRCLNSIVCSPLQRNNRSVTQKMFYVPVLVCLFPLHLLVSQHFVVT